MDGSHLTTAHPPTPLPLDTTLRTVASIPPGESVHPPSKGYTVRAFDGIEAKIERYKGATNRFAKLEETGKPDWKDVTDRSWSSITVSTKHWLGSFIDITIVDIVCLGLTIPFKIARFHWHRSVDKEMSPDDVATALNYLRTVEVKRQAQGQDALRAAFKAKELDETAVIALLEEGANPNILYNDSSPMDAGIYPDKAPLVEAVRLGMTTLVNALLKHGAVVPKAYGNANDLLIRAVDSHKPELVDSLIKAGADVNLGFPLLQAVRNQDIPMITKLIGCKVNINDIETDYRKGAGETALTLAARLGNWEIYDILVKAGANTNQLTATGASMLMLTIGGAGLPADKVKIVEDLIGRDADVNYWGRIGYSGPMTCALNEAAKSKQREIVELLLHNGAAWYYQRDGQTLRDSWPDYFAQKYEKQDVFRKEFQSDQISNTRVAELLEGGADPNASLDLDRSNFPLYQAVSQGNQKRVQLLLTHGANVNAIQGGDTGDTCLILAAKKGDDAMARLLLEAGANLNAMDKAGQTAEWWANTTTHTNVETLLRDYPPKVTPSAPPLPTNPPPPL